jgi:hypothetical protein
VREVAKPGYNYEDVTKDKAYLNMMAMKMMSTCTLTGFGEGDLFGVGDGGNPFMAIAEESKDDSSAVSVEEVLLVPTSGRNTGTSEKKSIDERSIDLS